MTIDRRKENKCDSIVSPSQIIIELDGGGDEDDGLLYSFKLDINDNLTNSYATVAATDASSPNSSHLIYQHPLITQKEHIKLIECCVIL